MSEGRRGVRWPGRDGGGARGLDVLADGGSRASVALCAEFLVEPFGVRAVFQPASPQVGPYSSRALGCRPVPVLTSSSSGPEARANRRTVLRPSSSSRDRRQFLSLSRPLVDGGVPLSAAFGEALLPPGCPVPG
jgi:hypothetical protein